MYAQYAKHGSGGLYYQKPAILERPSGTNDWVDTGIWTILGRRFAAVHRWARC